MIPTSSALAMRDEPITCGPSRPGRGKPSRIAVPCSARDGAKLIRWFEPFAFARRQAPSLFTRQIADFARHFREKSQERVILMKANRLDTHTWLRSNHGRRVISESGEQQSPQHCTRCRRNFVTDPISSEKYAVRVSLMHFSRLEDEITSRWLSEPCPRRHLPTDYNDRGRIFRTQRRAPNAL
jgi:hypothetical protein